MISNDILNIGQLHSNIEKTEENNKNYDNGYVDLRTSEKVWKKN